jgi:transposase
MKYEINNTPMSQKQTKVKAGVIKLGLDIHKSKYVVVVQVDGSSPERARQMSPDRFLTWITEQLEKADEVHSCYEAGCFGYVLHRKLTALGVCNLVVRPRNWDEYGQRVKTDKRDAAELCSHLDRYLAGNKKALTVVRVPSEREEQGRSLGRLREKLSRELKRLANSGQSTALYYGHTIESTWWKPKKMARLRARLPDYMIELLTPLQSILLVVAGQLKESTAGEERLNARKLPKGLGALTASVLDREICDYHRFSNRGHVSSYTGLCPSEHSSGGSRIQGSINKHGNRRIRHVLIEASWRLFQFQPDYHPVKKWKERMAREPMTKARRKKIAVAVAREFAVDWWRMQTGQTDPEKLGLQMELPTCSSLATWRKHQLKNTTQNN